MEIKKQYNLQQHHKELKHLGINLTKDSKWKDIFCLRNINSVLLQMADLTQFLLKTLMATNRKVTLEFIQNLKEPQIVKTISNIKVEGPSKVVLQVKVFAVQAWWPESKPQNAGGRRTYFWMLSWPPHTAVEHAVTHSYTFPT